ncbi:DNA-binding response regulator [Sulfurimicrobium lacus]|uniref:DNA-binding response regulator n=1 Tax=Sulfurimicrobium lacus TaxID=2715678 RepID=A0A6F8VG15_9PROT|nr:response regulator [Sulfurimicrobium lacus]BCB28290.1 DNA-binding response regulator [Sulfurimicrobium lacus]
MSIRVLLVDDHTLFRKGLAELLERNAQISVAGVTGSADEARQLLDELKPDVMVTDLHMQPIDGLSLLRQLQLEGNSIPTLVLTVSNAEEDLANVLRAGARGYLLKDMEPDDVADAIVRAARGETVVAPSMTMKLVGLLQNNQPAAQQPASMLDLLTQREREILSHLALGESNKVIARQLDISHDTVKLHVRHILSKLSLTSRVEAAIFAVEHKLSNAPVNSN